MLIFCVFNTSLIHKIILTKYGNASSTYPTYEEISYPKSGQAGSEITILMMSSVNDSNNCTIQPPDGYYYIQNVNWINTTNAVIMYLNRAQNKTILCVYDVACSDKCVNPIESVGWIATNVFQPVFSSKKTAYVLAPHPNGDNDKYTQVRVLYLLTPRF